MKSFHFNVEIQDEEFNINSISQLQLGCCVLQLMELRSLIQLLETQVVLQLLLSRHILNDLIIFMCFLANSGGISQDFQVSTYGFNFSREIQHSLFSEKRCQTVLVNGSQVKLNISIFPIRLLGYHQCDHLIWKNPTQMKLSQLKQETPFPFLWT